MLIAGALRGCWLPGLAFLGLGAAGIVLVIAVQFGLVTCMGVFNPLMATYRLEQTPKDRVTRPLSAWSVSSSVSIAALTALWGLLATLTSPRTAIAAAGVLILALRGCCQAGGPSPRTPNGPPRYARHLPHQPGESPARREPASCGPRLASERCYFSPGARAPGPPPERELAGAGPEVMGVDRRGNPPAGVSSGIARRRGEARRRRVAEPAINPAPASR